jgi:hypothetical protein
MMDHIQQAFAFDIHMRRDVDEKVLGDGIKVMSHDIKQGIVFEQDGVKVTAFLVDHGPVKPAFGYRVDYRGHSVALSGDTRISENLIRFAQGVDVLIHEVIDADAIHARPTYSANRQAMEAAIAHQEVRAQSDEQERLPGRQLAQELAQVVQIRRCVEALRGAARSPAHVPAHGLVLPQIAAQSLELERLGHVHVS